MAETQFGVDVSLFQGSIDWGKAKTSGLTFAVARCVQENGGVDTTFARNVAGQRKAGLIPGAYAFLAGGGVAKSQARTFIKAIGEPTGMLVMLDVERPSAHPTPTLNDVKTFVGEWRAAHPHHPLLIYGSSGSVLGHMGKAANLHQFGPLWLAYYRIGSGSTPQAFYDSIGGNHANQWRLRFGGWDGPSIWQFTSRHVHVAGIEKAGKARAVDMDAFRGTREQLLGLAGVGPVPHPAAQLAPPAAHPGSPADHPAPPAGHPAPPAAEHLAPQAGHPDAEQVFHIVKPGENLSMIAAKFGFKGFKALIAMFPENHRFAAHPNLIHPGDRIRVG